jgi:cell division septum initiation protein DivIVA
MSEIAAKLREYNRWRRGDEEIAQPDPGEIGRLLDAVCEMVEQLERERDMAEDERIDLAQQLRSEKEQHAKCQNERDEAREIAARLAHFLERPAYSVDEAIARMEALNSYKKLKSK